MRRAALTLALGSVVLAGSCAVPHGSTVARGPELGELSASIPEDPPIVLGPGPELPRPIELFDVYEVEGRDLAEIHRSIAARRPDDIGAFDAYTDWHIGWKATFLWRGDGCHVTSFWTTVQVRTALPYLVPSDDHPLELLAEWERYVEALRRHEGGHARIALDAANEMERLVAERHLFGSTRSELQAAIDATCRRVLRRAREREQRYDRETEHGRTQGARLAGR